MTLKTDLYGLYAPIVGGTLIWADQNSARPAMPYSIMKIMNIRRVKEDHYSDVGDDGIQTVKGDREFTLSLQRFGADSVEALELVSDKLHLTTNIDRFIAAKLPLVSADTVVDVAALLDATQIEPRASLDIVMRLKSSLADDVGYIDIVNITVNDDAQTATDDWIVSVDLNP